MSRPCPPSAQLFCAAVLTVLTVLTSLAGFGPTPAAAQGTQATAAPIATPAGITSPEVFLGHRVGADRKLAPWPKVVEYFRLLDAASERVRLESAGTSTLGEEMLVAVLTSERNQGNLERYREIARTLARPDLRSDLNPAGGLSPEQARALIAEGKVIALVTCTIHATEVGSTQMAMEFAHEVATTQDPAMLSWLDDVVLLLMPSINPDGQKLVIDWYQRQLGTPYEAGPMPWLYHPYVGHDNNRDFYMLTQKESLAVNDVLYGRWFPQIFLDEHQMGSTGPRMFVPPQADPLAPEVHSLVFRLADLLGTAMSMRLEEAGKLGVGNNMIFDSYWPGGTRNTAWWKNVTGLLTEVASPDIASPIYVEPGELQGNVKGLPEYRRQANFPSPWPGGWWRLRDVVEYELVATRSFLETAARYRANILENVYRMATRRHGGGRCRGRPTPSSSPPGSATRSPPPGWSSCCCATACGWSAPPPRSRSGGRSTSRAPTVIPAAQPYRPFLLTMLRPQRYPEVIPYVGGPVIPPYDVTAWSLPLLMGVEVAEAVAPLAPLAPVASGALAATAGREVITEPVWPGGDVAPGPGGYLISHAADSLPIALNRLLADGKEVYWLADPKAAGIPGEAGDVYLPPGQLPAAELSRLSREARLPIAPLAERPQGAAHRLSRVRVGLFKPWVASMDEGWTRFLLERYGFPFVNLSNEQLRDGSFRKEVDVVLLPDVPAGVLERGESRSAAARRAATPLPPPYAGGIGKDGGDRLRRWVEEGGTLVALDSAAEYAIDLLELPVEDVLDDVPREQLNAPGSLLRLHVDTRHPLGYGLAAEEAAYFADSPAFETHLPDARFDRRVVACYPEDEEDILVSGYLAGGELLERRAAVVEMGVGKGRVVLIGFRPQHRAQPLRTFKLLWNALYLAGAKETQLR